jgi:hypothetical protein
VAGSHLTLLHSSLAEEDCVDRCRFPHSVGPSVTFYFHHRQNLGVAVMQPILRNWGTSSSLQCQFFIQAHNIAQKPSCKISASGVCQQLATICNLSFRYVPIPRNNCIKTSQTAQSQLGLSFSTCWAPINLSLCNFI